MNEQLARYREQSVLPWGQALIPSVGFGTIFTLTLTHMYLSALVVGLLTALLTYLTLPRSFWSTGLDMSRTSPADFSRWDHIRPFLPGGLILGTGLLPGADLGWPLYFLGATAAMLWTFRASSGKRAMVVGRRRARVALAATPREEATTSRIQAAEKHRDVLLGLVALGAVDGIRARVWKLAAVMERAESEVHQASVALHRRGVVSMSTIDSGEDSSRHLVELTPVGVRVMAELAGR